MMGNEQKTAITRFDIWPRIKKSNMKDNIVRSYMPDEAFSRKDIKRIDVMRMINNV